MAPDDEFERGLEALKESFRASLRERIDQLDQLWSGLQAGRVTPGEVEALQRGLHSLAGSGRTFGVEGLSEAAAAAEAYAENFGPQEIPHAQSLEFARLLDAVRDAALRP